jgi:NDP-sugar pyrophosphorylase family protein
MPPMAVLAGGLATRLRSITATLPKSMLPVAHEPFVAHQLRLLARQGITDVVLCCGHLGEQIVAFVGDGSAFGCNVRYSFDGDRLKGTGGALKQGLPLLGETFMVMYGDSYLPTNFRAVYQSFLQSGKQGLMTLYQNNNLWDKSNVIFREGRILQYDKRNQTPEMHHIDYGLGVMRAQVLVDWNFDEPFDLSSVYEALVSRGELAGYEVAERFYEIGSHAGLNDTSALLEAIRREEETTPLERSSEFRGRGA